MGISAAGLGDFATDKDLEIEGVWVKISDEVMIKIRRAGGSNKAYDREVSRLSRPFKQQLQRGTLDNEEAALKIIRPAFIRTVVLDWEGIKDEHGKDLPFSPQACTELFDTYPDVYNVLKDTSDEMSTFRRREMEDTAERLGES